MYIVLMAMLALNVSTEVLDGFTLVEESLHRTTDNAAQQNDAIYSDFEEQMKTNPAKVKEWYLKAEMVKEKSQYLFDLISQIKHLIAVEADGADADEHNLQNKESLEAAAQVIIAPGREWGDRLYSSINSYREDMLQMVEDPQKKAVIAANLSTDVPRNKENKNWKEYYFEEMPAVAVMTYLTKLQSDIRYTEGEVLHTLVSNIDLKDVRVNALNAFVIPSSQTIVRGDKFSARIVMAAVDTTQTPAIYVGGQALDLKNGLYETVCGRTGDFTLAGYMEMLNSNGDLIRRDFEQRYTVVDPSATVSADLMNVLYAGYNNPISVSVPGVALTKVQATMSGGTLTAVSAGRYIARPSAVGRDVTITVTSTNSGHAQQMGQFTFHVRKLPDPTAYITTADADGSKSRFRGGGLSKTQLIAAEGIGAAIDDGILNIAFKVQSFETVFFDNMGNAVLMQSEGPRFSQQQKETFRRLTRNKRFYVSHVNATGPDGITRKLNTSMEVIIK